jgi:5'(3')-deoxyribonucleotidase
MKQLYIGVDVDGVLLDTMLHWCKWLEYMTGKKLPEPPSTYDMRVNFEDELIKNNLDGMNFWRRDNLYDNLEVDVEAIKALTQIFAWGHKIVVITRIKGNHHKSKYEMLKRAKVPIHAFLATHEKQYVDVDLIIDDNEKVLDAFKVEPRRRETKRVLFQTRYNTEKPVPVKTQWMRILGQVMKLSKQGY